MAKIYIDAGHGGNSIGATYKGRKEQDDTLRLALAVGNLIAEQGINVKYSRVTDVNPDLNKRTAEANDWNADYFISIHRNAYKPNAAQGVEAWVYSKAATNGDAYKKAETIVNNLVKSCGFKSRGVKKGATAYADYAVNSQTKMTSCLLECSFIDSDADNKIFDGKFNEMALAIAKGLCAAVGVTYKAPAAKTETKTETKTTATTGTIYRVQIGAYSSKENAEAVAKKAKAAGFDAIVVKS